MKWAKEQHSLAVVCASWGFLDTGLAGDRDGNAQCERRRPPGQSHDAQVGARAQKADGQPGSVRSHQVATQNRTQ